MDSDLPIRRDISGIPIRSIKLFSDSSPFSQYCTASLSPIDHSIVGLSPLRGLSAVYSQRARVPSSSGSTNASTALSDIDFTSATSRFEQPVPCKCSKSRCLKLYCECFANGNYCVNCKCKFCRNKPEHDAKRQVAIEAILEKNPAAQKKTRLKAPLNACNCKKSQCLKRYCECFQNSRFCGESCNCLDCKNAEEPLAAN